MDDGGHGSAPARKPRWSVIGGALLAFVFVVAVHWTALRGWWLYDDPQLVIEGISQSTLGALFDPSEYRHLAAHTFTPLLVLSFKADAAGSGVDPRGFYLHQLIALAAAASLLFLLLRRFATPMHALLGAALFALSWQVTYAARTLMIRHYVEGLVFALAALLVWTASRRPWLRDVAACTLYLLALLSKEIFAPLPLLFFVIALSMGDSLRRAAARMLLPAATLGIFLFWRWKMTGLLGSYTEPPTRAELLALPLKIWSQHLGPVPPAVAISVAILTAVALLAWIRRGVGALAAIVAAVIVVVLPVVPLAKSFEWRYSFGATVAIIALVTIAASRGLHRHGATILLLLLTLLGAFAAVRQRVEFEALTRSGVEREGRYLWTQPSSAPILAATAPEWYLQGIAWLRQHGGRGTAPRFIASRWAIDSGSADPARVVVFDERGATAPVSVLDPADPRRALFGGTTDWAQRQAARDDSLPLQVSLGYSGGEVRWQFAPAEGEFLFVTDPAFSASPLPAEGTRRVAQPREQNYFRIVRIAPGGRWTITPRLPIPADGAVTRWAR